MTILPGVSPVHHLPECAPFRQLHLVSNSEGYVFFLNGSKPMAATVDPTYPLYPIACILASAMLFLVSLTGLIRQSWNLGLASLCFWLFFENLTFGINAIIWADNADLKLYVYCDIVSHLQEITFFVRPMATLVITRRLYVIASQRSVDIADGATRRRTIFIEWILVLVLPLILAGPVYYTVQDIRFEIVDGLGCSSAEDDSVLDFLLLWTWGVIPPLISVVVYYPRVALLMYRQSRLINHFLRSNDHVSRADYFRMFAFASFDILLTLPFGIANIALSLAESSVSDSLVFYPGWTNDHVDWEPASYSYAERESAGSSAMAQQYFAQWTPPILAFAIFGIFGVTSEARASYRRAIHTAGRWFGWKPSARTDDEHSTLGDIGSRVPPLDTLVGSELRSHTAHDPFEAEHATVISKEGKLAACNVQDDMSTSSTKILEGPGVAA
ncbi:unnamed protein product [Peniophora sp. CBMAI 1063]|nr:unnamed protein product [Peniophora sp. CBMAI 1063]